MQNGYVESFNGKMRTSLLNETLFFTLDQARQMIAALDRGLQHRKGRTHRWLRDTCGIRREARRNRLSCYAPQGLRMPNLLLNPPHKA